MSAGLYLAIPLVALLAIIQATVLPAFPVLGVAPGLWLVMVVAWGLLRGMREGLFLAFVGGIFVDLISAAPLGVTSLSLMLSVALVTFLQRYLPKGPVLIPALLTALATIVFWLIYLLLLRLIMPVIIGGQAFLGIADLRAGGARNSVLNDIGRGYGLSAPVVRFILQSAIIHALLVMPFYWAVNRLGQAYGRRRVEI
ncbi:MAG TPA: rod shape-determining protein MreD [Anaerolineae bacterium]|jgi:rod shape-determining protein MreD|nr:rod shape-determining protein MreD [Anaerolineae bacterium]